MLFHHITYKLFNNSIYLRIVSLLIKEPKGASGRTLAKLADVSVYKMHHALKFLCEQGVIHYFQMGRTHVYSLHKEHVLVQKIFMPSILFQKEVFSQLGDDIVKMMVPKPLSVILYGSVAIGEERPDSDLDLLLVYKDTQKLDFKGNNGFFSKITTKYGNPPMVKTCHISDLIKEDEHNISFIKKILKQGIVLFGLSIRELLNG